MASTGNPDKAKSEAVPGDEAAKGHVFVPPEPHAPPTPDRAQPVDQAAQEDAAEERAEGGGYS